MIGLIEVASHFLCPWQAALLPPLRRSGGGRRIVEGQAASFITRVLAIISFSTCDQSNNLLDSVKFRVSLAVFNKFGVENGDITFLRLINLKVESKAAPLIAV